MMICITFNKKNINILNLNIKHCFLKKKEKRKGSGWGWLEGDPVPLAPPPFGLFFILFYF
jgi:hypothetical protein